MLARDTGEATVEREEVRLVCQGERERESVPQAERGVFRSELRRAARHGPIDGEDRDSCVGEELVHLVGAPGPEGPNQDLGVDRGAEHDAMARLEMGTEPLDRTPMVWVTVVQERDQDIGVRSYRSHSLRSSWR